MSERHKKSLCRFVLECVCWCARCKANKHRPGTQNLPESVESEMGYPPLRLTVERDGSISKIAGGPLGAPMSTGPTVPEANAAALELGLAWAAAMAVVPQGWQPLTLAPTDPKIEYDKAGNTVTEPWGAYACSQSFYDGETESNAENATGYGSTPIEALENLASALESLKP